MKTVLIVGKYYPPHFGGVELITKQCADALAQNYNVVLICHSDSNTTSVETTGRLRIIRCATPFTFFRQPISFAMARQIRAHRSDLLHFHAPNFWGAALVSVLRPHVPLLITHHADVEGRALLKHSLMPIYRRLLKRAKAVIVSSYKNFQLSTDLQCDETKIVPIPFGLNPNQFKPKDPAQEDSGPSPKTKGRVLFGFCGRFVWYKGLDVLLTAFSKIEGADLLLIGDGPLMANVKAMIASLDLSDRVTLTGQVSEAKKIQLLQEIDVFLLPSTHITETFGMSQIEAQMCAIPCISANLPTGVSDVVQHEVTGLLVEPGSVPALEAAMVRLASDQDFRLACGQRARERAIAMFSEDAFSRRYLELVAKLLIR